MDTVVSITTYGTDTKALEDGTTKAFTAFKDVADVTDPYEEHKKDDLYNLNAKGNDKPFKAAPTVFTLLDKVRTLGHKEINLCLGDVIAIWQTHGKTKTVPLKIEVEDALAKSPFDAYSLNKVDGTVTVAPYGKIDLGAVAKGYGVDAAADILKKDKNIKSALINAGGNIMVLGTKEDRKPWHIGIQDPRDSKKLLGTLSLTSGLAVATSGDYQRYYEVDGIRYHHILDPKTGFPVQDTMSATAVAKSGFLSDYYSTLLFILPLDRAKELVEKTPDLEAIIKPKKGDIYISSGLKTSFTLAQ